MLKNVISLILFLTLLVSCASGDFERITSSTSEDPLSCYNHFVALMSYSPGFNKRATENANQIILGKTNTLREFEKSYGGWSFFEIHSQFSDAKIRRFNKKLRTLLAPGPMPEQKDPKYVYRLTNDEADRFYQSFENNPVGSCSADYEPGGIKIGFCFGRAIIAHIEALRYGVHPSSIKKIWVVGDMKEWGHHVATMIKTESGWKVFDNETGLVSAHRWIELQQAEKKPGAKPLMFFVSSAERFGPSNNGTYQATDLFGDGMNDYYNGFFSDYFRWVHEGGSAPTFKEERTRGY